VIFPKYPVKSSVGIPTREHKPLRPTVIKEPMVEKRTNRKGMARKKSASSDFDHFLKRMEPAESITK
jgi:hypothetical protein